MVLTSPMDLDSWYRIGTPDHTHTRGPSVASMRDFLIALPSGFWSKGKSDGLLNSSLINDSFSSSFYFMKQEKTLFCKVDCF